MADWKQIKQRYSTLSLREKGLILLSGLVLFLFGGYTLVVEPGQMELSSRTKQVNKLDKDQIKLQQQLQRLNQQLTVDPNALLQAQILELQQRNSELDAALAAETVDLIPPQRMAEVLETLLAQGNKLKLLSMTSLAPEPTLTLDDNAPAGEEAEQALPQEVNLYRHGIVLRVKGRYFDILDFLSEVESLPWHFYWQRFDYQVERHPQAIAEIELFSLSTSKEFMGG